MHATTRKIALPDDGVETLFGTHDENLRHLETLFGVEIRTDGHDLLVEGDGAGDRARRALRRPGRRPDEGRLQFAPGEVKTAAQLVAEDPAVDLRDYFLRSAVRGVDEAAGGAEERATSAPTSTRSRSTTSSSASARPAPARPTWRWRRRWRSCSRSRSAGIILARPAVEAGEKLGFLPGDLQEKVNPYLRPLYDALYDMMELEKAERLIERGIIEVAPIAFMRGRTLNDAFVILDEAQNTTSEQMKMFLTRLGFGSKAVITGDITQIDLPTGRISGPDRGAERRAARSKASPSSTSTSATWCATSWCSRSSRPTTQFTAGEPIPLPRDRLAHGDRRRRRAWR